MVAPVILLKKRIFNGRGVAKTVVCETGIYSLKLCFDSGVMEIPGKEHPGSAFKSCRSGGVEL